MNFEHLAYLKQMEDLDVARMLEGIMRCTPWPVLPDGVELDPLALIGYMIPTMADSAQSVSVKVIGAALGQLGARFDQMGVLVRVGLRETALEQASEWTQGFEAGQRTLAFQIGQVLGLGTTIEEMLSVTKTETETKAA